MMLSCFLIIKEAKAQEANGKMSTLSIVFTSDVHGNISNCETDSSLSYAFAAKERDDIVNAGQDALLVDAGDHIQGRSYATLDKGHEMVKIMKTAKYDFAVPGNHEVDYGVDYFKEIKIMQIHQKLV